jgi:alpha-L-rhamnosidase
VVDVSRRDVLGGMAGTAALTAFPAGVRGGPAGNAAGSDMRPVGLTTNHVTNPLGISTEAPRFGWRLVAPGRDRAQRAYRIMVASAPERLEDTRPDIWDSGRVDSSEQSARVYAGPALRARTRYFWAVRVWDEAGGPGPMSEIAWFETALGGEQDWAADWIGSGIDVSSPVRVLAPQLLEPTRLERGHSLGQTFDSTSDLVAVTVLLDLEQDATADVVMTLHRGGPGGEVLARKELADVAGDRYGNASCRLDVPDPVAPGPLYLELACLRGEVSWLGTGRDAYDGGEAHADGQPVEGDRWLCVIPPDPPPNPLLRKEFTLSAPVVSARLYLVGLGNAVAWINGERVGDAELTPPATDYDKRVLTSTYDVTDLLRSGDNALGIALGRGFFASRAPDTDGSNLARWVGEPRARAQLEVTLRGGRRVTVATGADWVVTEGPTTYDGVYAGESYDARRAAELTGWTSPGFAASASASAGTASAGTAATADAGGWRPATVVDGPGGRLEAYAGEPIRAGQPVRPVRVTRPAEGVRVYDFGVVMSGWVRLHGRLPAGATVRLLHSEKLGPSGRIEPGIPGGNENPAIDGRFQVDEYTAVGGAEETWRPSSTYKGFRYVEVTGSSQPLDLVAVPVGNDVATTMALRLDDPVLQWIVEAVRQTTGNGMQGHPVVSSMFTKMGWTLNTYRASQPMLYQFGMANVFATWLDDLALGQAADGELPLIAPQGETSGGFLLTPSSTGVYPSLVRRYWLTYGDRTIPQKHFAGVRRYVEWLLGKLTDGIADDQFGDWYPPRPEVNPQAPEGGTLVGTAYVIESLRDATAVAELLRHTDLARTWRSRTAELIDRFTDAFLDADAGHYRTAVDDVGYRQTSNAVPLALGLVPSEHVDTVVAGLASNVEEQDRHLDTGALGTPALPYALSDHGRADLAHAVLTQRDYPSYGCLRGLGATTLWENWEVTARGHNDTMLSQVAAWFVERVVGVEVLQPGWARFRVAPRAFGPLPGARLELDTVRGRIEVAWRREGGDIELTVCVPVNAVAELTLPDGEQRRLGSGRHQFLARMRPDAGRGTPRQVDEATASREVFGADAG